MLHMCSESLIYLLIEKKIEAPLGELVSQDQLIYFSLKELNSLPLQGSDSVLPDSKERKFKNGQEGLWC